MMKKLSALTALLLSVLLAMAVPAFAASSLVRESQGLCYIPTLAPSFGAPSYSTKITVGG